MTCAGQSEKTKMRRYTERRISMGACFLENFFYLMSKRMFKIGLYRL